MELKGTVSRDCQQQVPVKKGKGNRGCTSSAPTIRSDRPANAELFTLKGLFPEIVSYRCHLTGGAPAQHQVRQTCKHGAVILKGLFFKRKSLHQRSSHIGQANNELFTSKGLSDKSSWVIKGWLVTMKSFLHDSGLA
jgi:hypothetical protein